MIKEPVLQIVADENMPGVVEWFSPFGEVTCLPGRQITAEQLSTADVLLVRSVTAVNEELLANSPVKFVGSATIGVDHVDVDYLASRSIQFCHSPGCNAQAVVEYVLSCLAALQPDWQSLTVGVIGCGNVGGRLLNQLSSLGVSCKGYDPFLESNSNFPLADLDDVLQCDVISMHTPLTMDGRFPSYHLLNQDKLALIKGGALLINAGRGSAIDGQALLHQLKQQRFRCVLDVWEHEPDVCLDLLDAVDVATPHIAGYSLDGKMNGTGMVLAGFLSWLGKTAMSPSLKELEEQRDLLPCSLNETILQAYDVRRDSARFHSAIAERGNQSVAVIFDQYRKNYPHRLEFSHYHLAEQFLTEPSSSGHLVEEKPAGAMRVEERSLLGKLGFGETPAR